MAEPDTNGSTASAAQRVIADIEASRQALTADANSILTGGRRAAGRALALSGLAGFELVVVVLLLARGTDIGLSRGVAPSSLGTIRILALLAMALGAVGAVRLTHGRARRSVLSCAAGGVLVIATASAAVATSLLPLGVALVAAGLAVGAGRTLHPALIADVAGPGDRTASLAWHRAAAAVGPLVIAGLLALAPGTWRTELVVVALVTAGVAALGALVIDPGFGTTDAVAIRQQVNAETGDDTESEERLGLSFSEAIRRVLASATARSAVLVFVTAGSIVVPLFSFGAVLLRERLLVSEDTRVWLLVTAAAMGGPGALAARRAGRRLLILLPLGAAVVFAVTVAWVSSTPLAWVGVAVAFATCAALEAPVLAAALTAVPSTLRPHAAGLCAAGWALGAMEGLTFIGSMQGRYGHTTTAVVLALVVASLAALVQRTFATADAEVEDVAGDLVEDQRIRQLQTGSRPVPLLSCRHIDFSYGSLQVLFDVSFTVEAGEMVALLGTNGAGKSTLLRAISGLGRPDRGTVRVQGEDVTHLDPQRRTELGVLQIPGGKAMFPRLTVAENLRAYSYSLGRDKRRIESGMDRVFAQFPRLAERRNQPATTLSGGEAQMLALGKALLLSPRILLIDELSLGLAPKVVGELLERLRAINAEGTAIVLVEQSVNIALSLVDHAYFMENGQIRFDGRAADLLGRDNLLRSVFLAGAMGATS